MFSYVCCCWGRDLIILTNGQTEKIKMYPQVSDNGPRRNTLKKMNIFLM